MDINEKISQGKAVVATAEEIIGIVKDGKIGLWGEVKICQTSS